MPFTKKFTSLQENKPYLFVKPIWHRTKFMYAHFNRGIMRKKWSGEEKKDNFQVRKFKRCPKMFFNIFSFSFVWRNLLFFILQNRHPLFVTKQAKKKKKKYFAKYSECLKINYLRIKKEWQNHSNFGIGYQYSKLSLKNDEKGRWHSLRD